MDEQDRKLIVFSIKAIVIIAAAASLIIFSIGWLNKDDATTKVNNYYMNEVMPKYACFDRANLNCWHKGIYEECSLVGGRVLMLNTTFAL
jgi:hypothetical protein